MIQQFHSGYIPQRIEIRDSKRDFYTHVHRSMIHSSQEMEATQVSTDRRMKIYTQWNTVQQKGRKF